MLALLIDTICFRLLPYKYVVALFIRDEKIDNFWGWIAMYKQKRQTE